MPAIGSYITVELMGGGRTSMIGYSIAQQFSASANWPFGSAMSLLMMIIVTVARHALLQKRRRKKFGSCIGLVIDYWQCRWAIPSELIANDQ
ncbi:MAG: hypothetical protein HC853_03185 [Anaerolineae bacterium]|nr:hypothetical protein [Anaerolineae bacterium]